MAWGHKTTDSVATIRHAIESGINWIDTAPMDGLSHAEEVIGKALHDIPEADRPHVFTKCGLQMGRERELQSTAIQEI